MSDFESSAGNPAPGSTLRRILVALLLASAAVPVYANSSAASADVADTADTGQQPANQQNQDIVVTGQSLFRDIQPEQSLDEQAIESYGVSTIDELLDEVQREAGEDEEPAILVNGERINDISEIGALPVQALQRAQVLPRGSAVRVGGRTGQRVISLTLKRQTRSATVTAAPKVSTDGDWHAARGEAILTYIRGSTRANVALRARDETSLLESERGIVQPEPIHPYALGGNVVGYPDTSGEIDPLLSSLAGQTVTVAAVPATSTPTLAGFAAAANQPNVTDLGQFRTLRPDVRNYELNGTFSTRLAAWLTSNATVRLSRNTSRSLRGLPPALFLLTAGNAFSPFANDVGLTYYVPEPLHSRSRRTSGDANLTLNGHFGKWVGNLNARHSEFRTITATERQATSGTITLADDFDPFGADLTDLIALQTSRSLSRSITDLTQLAMTGPLARLPAGNLQATLEGRLSSYRLRSENNFAAINSSRRFHRNEQSIRGAADIPLTSREAGVFPQIGDLDATAEYAHTHFSDAGSLDRYALGLTWNPIELLQLRGMFEETDTPPSIQTLGEPVVETPGVRVFDPLTGETVDVVQITGGNPSLKPQKAKVWRLSSLVRLVPRLNLQLNGEYTDTDQQNYISSLPDESAAVMLAFPDRYIRDSNGVLTTVDLRPVNFDSHREKRLRWGLSMKTKISGGRDAAPPPVDTGAHETGAEEAGEAAPQRPVVSRGGRARSTYLQLTANHTVVFSDKILIRRGLDSVNLLEGGALGIASGRVRHQVDATAAVTSRGLGARIGVTWRGASTLDTRIGGVTDTLRFSPIGVVNLRVFADMHQVAPRSAWAKGLRLSVNVANLTNGRQRVRDSFGNTPLQYQPAYRDPLGRTIELEIRKVF